MVKTTVYLTEETKRRLRSAARLKGVSEADLIREAIHARVAEAGRGFKLSRAPVTSDTMNSADVDAELAEGFGEC